MQQQLELTINETSQFLISKTQNITPLKLELAINNTAQFLISEAQNITSLKLELAINNTAQYLINEVQNITSLNANQFTYLMKMEMSVTSAFFVAIIGLMVWLNLQCRNARKKMINISANSNTYFNLNHLDR